MGRRRNQPTNKGNQGCARIFLIVWSLGFGGGGVIAFLFITVWPWQNSRAAKNWTETRCKITNSKVVTSHSSEGGNASVSNSGSINVATTQRAAARATGPKNKPP